MANYVINVKTLLETGQIKKQLAEIGQKQTIKFNVEGEPVKIINQTKDALGNTEKTITTLNKKNLTWNQTLTTTTGKLSSVTKSTMSFGEQLKEAYSKFAIWSAATVSWYQVIRTVKDMISQVKILDDSLVELQKVTDLEGESLNNFTDQAFDAADKVAKTGSQMVDAATEFAKSGYDEDQILQLGQIAL